MHVTAPATKLKHCMSTVEEKCRIKDNICNIYIYIIFDSAFLYKMW